MKWTFTKLRSTLSRLRDDQSGQSLVILVLSMTVLLGVAALSIDVGGWYVQHHRDQLVADAAALAAANCLASPNAPTGLGPACTSSTDTSDAKTVAVDYAAANGLTITASNVTVDTTADTVSVVASANAPSIFARLSQISSVSTGAFAQAKWAAATTSTACTSTVQAAGQCYVIYATDSACPAGGSQTQGVVFTQGSTSIDGGVHSDGNLFLNPGGSTYYSLTYGTGSGCGAYTYSGLNNGSSGWANSGGTFKSGSPTSSTGSATVPVPYGTTADPFPACTVTLSGTDPLIASWSIAPQPNQVYCLNNTSPSANAIDINTSSALSGDTFICTSGSGDGACSIVNQGGGVTFSADNYPTNKLLMYATGSINMGGGSGQFTGDLDAPNGTITANSGSNTSTGLLEGLDVLYGQGTVIGDGPTIPGSSTGTPGTDSLTQ